MKEIEIKLFGAFKKFIPSGKITVQVSGEITAIELKRKINEVFREQRSDFQESTLVFESALATDSEILQEDVTIDERSSLALLPPVCGG